MFVILYAENFVICLLVFLFVFFFVETLGLYIADWGSTCEIRHFNLNVLYPEIPNLICN